MPCLRPDLIARMGHSLPAILICAAPAVAQQLQVASQREGIEIVATSELPTGPGTDDEASVCGFPEADNRSVGAEAVSAAGWLVTNQYGQGAFDYVSFVGRATPGTSGSCLYEDGHVAVFRGEELLAVVSPAADSDRDIGMIVGWQDQGGVRIFDGEYLPAPLADLKVHAENLALVRPVATRDSFCGGRIEVPNVYGLPIHQARILLLDEGWGLHQAQSLAPSDPASDIAQGEGGLPEIQGCAGTGFGYCNFQYDWADGVATLTLTTAGDWPEGSSPPVVNYGAECN